MTESGSVVLSVDMGEAASGGEVVDPLIALAASDVGVRRLPFPTDVIVVEVRWYLRFGLSYRDVEELLAERGIEVNHVTVYRWVQRFTALRADAARLRRYCPGAGGSSTRPT